MWALMPLGLLHCSERAGCGARWFLSHHLFSAHLGDGRVGRRKPPGGPAAVSEMGSVAWESMEEKEIGEQAPASLQSEPLGVSAEKYLCQTGSDLFSQAWDPGRMPILSCRHRR